MYSICIYTFYSITQHYPLNTLMITVDGVRMEVDATPLDWENIEDDQESWVSNSSISANLW